MPEAFAIATQMYVRLRRVCSRVIDVMYLVHDQGLCSIYYANCTGNARCRISALC